MLLHDTVHSFFLSFLTIIISLLTTAVYIRLFFFRCFSLTLKVCLRWIYIYGYTGRI